jgi:hypothetical protein
VLTAAGRAFNFAGHVIGPGGATQQRLRAETGAMVQVFAGDGDLKGRRPDPLDPEVEVLIAADSQVCCLCLSLAAW